MFSSIVEAVFSYAERTPDKLCVADDKESLTYAGYASAIRRYVTVYTSLGVGRGDYVVLEAKQSIDYLASELALQLIGAIFVPVENKCAEAKITALAERVGAAVTVTGAVCVAALPVQTGGIEVGIGKKHRVAKGLGQVYGAL